MRSRTVPACSCHNLSAFLLVLYAGARESTDEGMRQTLLPALTAALRNLP